MMQPTEHPGEFWTAPTESTTGRLIMVTGRADVARYRSNPRYSIRVQIMWRYAGDASGMPQPHDAELMAEAQERLQTVFDKDPVAVLTGIYTGDDMREWIFYTVSTHIFGRKLNEALAPMPMLPLQIYTENDPEWAEYDEMSQARINLD